jgi:hypothetical protein
LAKFELKMRLLTCHNAVEPQSKLWPKCSTIAHEPSEQGEGGICYCTETPSSIYFIAAVAR